MNIVTKDGLEYFWGKLKDMLALKVDKYIDHKSYENDFFYNSTTNGNCTGYDREFAQVVANDWNKPWFVRMIIKTDMFYNNTTHYPTFHDILVGCDNVSGTTWVRNYNVIKSTSYRSAHYINVYRPQSALKAENAPFRLNFRAGDSSSKTNNFRSYDVYLVEAVNCTCKLNNELDNQAYQKWYFDDHSVNAYYWSAKSGGSFYSTNFDICSNGLQETSDANTYDRLYDVYYRAYAGSTIYSYKYLMRGADERLYPIVTTSGTGATKSVQTVGLRPEGIWYYSATTTINTGGAIGSSTIYRDYPSSDSRYNFNGGTPTYSSIYLCGDYDVNTGLFYLATTDGANNSVGEASVLNYFVSIPTNTVTDLSTKMIAGRYYLFIGGTYSSANYIQLMDLHPLYYFDGTNLILVVAKSLNADKVNGHTVDIDVPSNAKFTDTVTTTTTTGSGNAITSITASNGALSVTKGTTFLTTHQDISGKADKSTTLEGYGIQNAYTKQEVDTKIATAGGVTWSDIYPVGAIYISTTNVSPSTFWGGTWERMNDDDTTLVFGKSSDMFWSASNKYFWGTLSSKVKVYVWHRLT